MNKLVSTNKSKNNNVPTIQTPLAQPWELLDNVMYKERLIIANYGLKAAHLARSLSVKQVM